MTNKKAVFINVIINGSACSVLFLSMTALFSAYRNILEEKSLSSVVKNVLLRAENKPGVLQNSIEHAKPLFIAFRQVRTGADQFRFRVNYGF